MHPLRYEQVDAAALRDAAERSRLDVAGAHVQCVALFASFVCMMWPVVLSHTRPLLVVLLECEVSSGCSRPAASAQRAGRGCD